jgi:phosphatidylglycerophosphate synthase
LLGDDGALMLDLRLRSLKDRTLRPVVILLSRRVSAAPVTVASLAACLAAAVVAARGGRWLAVALWLVGRTLDGVDGMIARHRNEQSDLGGYLDMLADTIGYATVPIGIAVHRADGRVWTACAVLLASFYVNTMSWTYLAAIAEKRSAGAVHRGEVTTIHMPPGLIEGAETIVLFAVMLAWPGRVTVTFSVMAVLVGVTILQRVAWAIGHLRRIADANEHAS